MKNFKDFLIKITLPITTILLLTLCLLLFEALNKEKLFNDLSLNVTQESIDAIETRLSSLEYKLFPESSFLESKACTFGNFDAKNYTIPITLSFTPKTNFNNSIIALLHCNGENIPLELEQGAFIAKYETSIFRVQNISAITFIDGETSHTERLNWNIEPASEVVPNVFSYFTGSIGPIENKGLEYSLTLHFYVLSFPSQWGQIKELNLIKKLNNTIQETQPINFSNINLFNTGNLTIEKSISGKVLKDDTLELIIEMVDNNGLSYQCVQRLVGDSTEDNWNPSKEVRVFNKDKELLYVYKDSNIEVP